MTITLNPITIQVTTKEDKLSVTLYGVEILNLLDTMTYEEILNYCNERDDYFLYKVTKHFGTDKTLDAIGKTACKDHFDLIEG